MKRIITKLGLLVLSLISTTLFAQSVLTVSSDADSGVGSLRQIILDSESGDSIVIPSGYTILLNSEIAFDKSLKINGQGSTVQVSSPGVSTYRVFTIGTSTSTSNSVGLYNLSLLGGNVSSNTGTVNQQGGTMYVYANYAITMKNCVVSKGKGTYVGGLIMASATGSSVTLDNCTFTDLEATTSNGGACILKGTTVVNNCVFTNNTATAGNGSAIAAYSQSTIKDCTFKNNIAKGTTGSAVINYAAATGTVDLINCTFDSNLHINGTNGVGGFAIPNSVAVSTLTNCTFYGNSGQTTGAVWNNQGTLTIVNCTFSGNTSNTVNGGGFHSTSNANCKTTIVNSILTHNYNSSSTLMDLSMGTLGTVDGTKNIVGAVTGSPTYTNSVTFSYSPASDLFASYTTTGTLMPVLSDNGGVTKTIGLSNTGIANGTGISTYGTTNIVPATDHRGVTRASTPWIGAFEYKVSTEIESQKTKNSIFIFPNPVSNYLIIETSNTVLAVQINDLSGKNVLKINNPTNTINLSDVTRGIYFIKVITSDGEFLNKLIIK